MGGELPRGLAPGKPAADYNRLILHLSSYSSLISEPQAPLYNRSPVQAVDAAFAAEGVLEQCFPAFRARTGKRLIPGDEPALRTLFAVIIGNALFGLSLHDPSAAQGARALRIVKQRLCRLALRIPGAGHKLAETPILDDHRLAAVSQTSSVGSSAILTRFSFISSSAF